ncbi:hypothetical protein EJ04DRAFT_427514 [Polyplosphaeria fusca]|uniref:Pentatricopeptide repeat-containing protein n=1 Tax=Polyplosphaeria fusca TaxID=682080 RepID=A0A9P4R993_9PLEO|nr:hypothetical protein EJ04DRAFT_427514 [Polyplosphaeria fusca]
MQIVGRTTNAGPRAKYYKYMFSYISASRALKEWEAEHSSEPQDGFKAQHLEVGAKMHAYAGHPDRAQEIMNELNRLYPEWSVGVAMAVFRSYTRSESDQHVAEAWKMYKMMREHLGTSATMEHYDSWFSGFLEARHLPFAKIVFKDTIAFSNTIVDKHTGSDLSRKKLEKLLRRLHLLYRLGDDIEKMTGIILLAISILPKDYHSHLFRDWMKSAVVHQAPEVAAQILEMMGKRGLEPAPFHFNLLLRTLLRTGEKRNILRAENLGWRMVDTAIKEPPRTTSNRDAIDALANSERNGTAHQRTEQLQSHIPPANVSTYALIMRHHYNNFQWEHVDYLARKLKESKIRPNSALMTILMDIKCRQGRYDEVWAIYQSSTNVRDGMAGGVFPDGAAIRCLWKTLRLALGDDESREKGVLPTPRELLAETVAWWNLVRNRHDAERFKIGFAGADGGAISGLVMHCFSYTQDLPGSLVALHVLRKRFGIFPSDQAASILQKQTAWVDLRRESAAVKQSFGRGDSHARALDRMGRIYDVLKKQRFKKHNITPDVYAQLSKTEIGDLGLNLVSEFIRVVLKRQHPPEQIESMIDEAKSQIKLPYLKTGDMDISQVV